MATVGVLLIFVHAVTKQIEVWPVVPVDGLKQAAVYLWQKLHHLQAKKKKKKRQFYKDNVYFSKFHYSLFRQSTYNFDKVFLWNIFFRGWTSPDRALALIQKSNLRSIY
jgi:hypothetical protein